MGRVYSGNSVNQAVDVVRRFYRWAVATGHLGRDPAAHLLTQRVASKPRRELSLEESRALLSQPNPQTFYGARDRAILALIIEHRLPFKALARLDLCHFHYDTGAILVSGRRAGILSVSDGLTDDLERYLSEARPGVAKVEEPALFVGRDGDRMSDVSFRAILDRHAQAAGLGKLRSSS
jgi:integrase/recombinase XerD